MQMLTAPPSRRATLAALFAPAVIAGSATLDRTQAAPVAKRPVFDDGPLRADDVTGTDAFARWEARRLAAREA